MTHHYNPNLAASVTTTGQKILMTIIKQRTPALLAHDILGVQPMTGSVGEIFTMRANYGYQPKYKFSRKWYIADISDADYHDVRAWCTEQFGPEDKFPNAWSRWQHRYEHQIFLRDEKDYNWFVLRWGA